MAEQEIDYAELTAQSSAYRNAALSDFDAVAAAAESLGSTVQTALELDPSSFTATLLGGLNEVLYSAQLLTETLQTGLDLDATALGEDGLLGILDQLTERTDGVVGFFEELSSQASEASGWLAYVSESLGFLYDLSQVKGAEQTNGLLLQLETRQIALDENRLLETANQQVALDERFAGLQAFLTTTFDLQNQSLLSEQGLLTAFQQSGLLSQQQFEGLSLALKAASVNESLGLAFFGQQAEGQIAATGLTDKLSMASQAFGGLSQLMSSENTALFRIGQAAAIADAGVQTALGAIKAYQSMAGIQVVGPALGAVAAAAVVASGAISIKKIASQKPGKGGGGAPSFKAVSPGGGAAAPRVSAPNLPNVAGSTGASGAGGEVQIHLADKPILNAVAKAAKDGRLVIDSRAIQ